MEINRDRIRIWPESLMEEISRNRLGNLVGILCEISRDQESGFGQKSLLKLAGIEPEIFKELINRD